MTRTFVAITALLLSGCSASDGASTDQQLPPLTDSDPVRSTHDLAAGIDQSWHFTVGEPAAGTGRLSFTLLGPSGAPARMDALCFEFSYEQRTSTGTHDVEGRRGSCGGGLSASPELALEGAVVFRLAGAEVLPGTYSFHATGGPQLASLSVELVAR